MCRNVGTNVIWNEPVICKSHRIVHILEIIIKKERKNEKEKKKNHDIFYNKVN